MVPSMHFSNISWDNNMHCICFGKGGYKLTFQHRNIEKGYIYNMYFHQIKDYINMSKTIMFLLQNIICLIVFANLPNLSR
jgi:hypothetical protein